MMGRQHARNYFQIPSSQLVAIAEVDEKLGQEVAHLYGAKYYKDHKKMLMAEKPSIVSIAVPTIWHYPVALDAIASGSHLLIEKPIAASLQEAKEVVDAASAKGVLLTVGHIERFNPAILKLKEMIKRGKLGTIVSVMARRTGTIPSRIRDANVIVDIGVHDIDLINFILEKKPEHIFASGGRAILRKHEDYADIFLEYPAHKNGLRVTGHVQTNWITPVKIRKLNVTGTRGYAVVNMLTQDLFIFDTDYTQEFDNFEDFVGKFKEAAGEKVEVRSDEPLRLQIEHFIDAVLNSKPPTVLPEDAVQALRIAILATENIRLKEGRV